MSLKVLILIITILAFFGIRSNALQDRCLGLVLKGGANKGSYEAGAVFTLINNLPPEEVQYDVISGISVGALNAAHCSTYPKGQERQMALDLLDMWNYMKASDIYRKWKGGLVSGIIWEQSLYDATPLHEFIKEYFSNRTVQRLVHFNSVDFYTGDIVQFDESTEKEDFLTGLMGTTAVPFVFQPVPYKDKLLMDGGVAWNLDIASALHKCRTLVDSDSKIVIDVIDVDKNIVHLDKEEKTGNTIQNVLRYLGLKNYYNKMSDHVEIQYAHPEVKFRYVIIPQNKIISMKNELSFDPHLIQTMINQGMQDALHAIKNYPHHPNDQIE